MAYFASRAAAMGPVGPAIVSAKFYNFHPGMLTRSIPDAWGFSTPERVLEARHDAVNVALRRLVPADLQAGAHYAAGAIRQGLSGVSFARRPLAAAHAGLPPSEDPRFSVALA